MAVRRRRQTRLSPPKRIGYRAARALALLILRIRNAFSALRPAGRITAGVVTVGVIAGAILLLASPSKTASANKAIAPITLANGSVNTGADAQSTILELPVVTPEPTPEPTPVPTPTPDPSLYEGVPDSEAVTDLQNRLMDLGYLDIDEPTQHFGPATKYAVELFQRQHNLQQDGWAGEQTLALIYSDDAQKYTLLEGTRGTDVDNFQRQLKALGYLSKTTGYYGTETIEAVKAFQKENDLHVDGKAGQKTFDMINSDDAKQSPNMAKEARRKANIDVMIETAKKQLGDKYILGNEGPNSFDCSGLVYYCLKEGGSNRRRLNAAGYSKVSDWENISSYSGLKKGDLIFFYNTGKTKIGHVGIYIGGGEMVDASSNNGKVVRRSINTSYWKSHFVNARRPW